MLGLNKQVRFFFSFWRWHQVFHLPFFTRLFTVMCTTSLSPTCFHCWLPISSCLVSSPSPSCTWLYLCCLQFVIFWSFYSFFLLSLFPHIMFFFSTFWHRSPIVVVVIQLYEIICEASQCCEPDPKCTGVSFPCWVHPVSTQPSSMSSSLYVLQFVSVANKIINTALSWTNNVKLLLSLFAGWVDTNCAEQTVNNLAP